MGDMHSATHLPSTGEVFLDARGGSRTLRVSWHTEVGLVSLSVWREGSCAGTFRLPVEEVPDLIDVLRDGLAQAYDDAHRSLIPGMPGMGGADNLAG